MRLDEEKATVANRRRMSEKQAREWLSAAHWTGKKQAGLSTLEGRVGQLKGRAPKRPGRGEKRSWRVSRGPKPGRGGPI
jgi:tetrahydrodipicolinate N-succinyltransferase